MVNFDGELYKNYQLINFINVYPNNNFRFDLERCRNNLEFFINKLTLI